MTTTMTRSSPGAARRGLAALAVAWLAGTPAVAADSDARGALIGATRSLHDALVAGRVEPLAALLATEYTMTDSKGKVHSRNDVLGLARRHDVDLESTVSELSDLRVTVVKDTGVVTGIAEERLAFSNRNEKRRWRFTEVWVATGSGWSLIASHESAADLVRIHSEPASRPR